MSSVAVQSTARASEPALDRDPNAPAASTDSATGSTATTASVTPEAAAQTRPARLPWLDLARAGAIIAVVLFHVSIGYYYGLQHAETDMVARWDRINQVVTAVRMPLLFTISGLLAAGKIRRGFARGSAIESSVTNYYLYAVWTLVFLGLSLVGGDTKLVTFQLNSFQLFLQEFWAPTTPLWYIFSLAIYIPLFTALRKVRPEAVLAVLFMVHLASVQTWSLESPLWTRGIQYAIYFAVGVYGGTLVRRVAETPWLALLSAGAAYLSYKHLGMTKLMAFQPATTNDAISVMVLYITAGLTVMGMAAMLARVRPYAVLGSFIGRRTLGIYVLHIPVIGLLVLLSAGPLGFVTDTLATNAGLDFAFPFIATAVVIAGCLSLETLLTRIGLGFLFAVPSAVTDLIGAARTRYLTTPSAATDLIAADEARRTTPA